MFLKKIILFSGILMSCLFFSSISYAEECTIYEPTEFISSIGKSDVVDCVNINGESNELYPVFLDKHIAIKNVNKTLSKIIGLISENSNLAPLTTDNWQDYKDCMNVLPDKFFSDNEISIQYSQLEAFFDIYENDIINKEIKTMVYSSNGSISESQQFDLGCMLPTYSKLAIKVQDKIRNSNNFGDISNSVSAAVAYAKSHATNPNIAMYNYLKDTRGNPADCTNFASQILEAAGAKQDIYSSIYSGWWHKKIGSMHTYSTSWIRADTFAKYMGVGFKTTSHGTFSKNILTGDFISYDSAKDGSWDHIGFVCAKASSYMKHPHGGWHEDYMVAQHTKDYCSWCTVEQNGWPFVGGYYGRVRR